MENGKYVALAALALCFILFAGFTFETAEDVSERTEEISDNGINTKEPGELLKGVSVSPKSFAQDDFTDFLDRVKRKQDILMWAGDWAELGDGASKTITELAPAYNYVPLVEVTHFIQDTGKLLRPLNEENKKMYKDRAVSFAEKYRPEYLGFGIEIDVLYDKSPDDFDEFVEFYNEVYNAVKEVSPDTKVFTIFQLEKMKGHELWSIDLDSSKAKWFLIDRFDSDIVAFTTYPGLVHKKPADIREDYYVEISSYTTKPIAFTEIGWHSAASPAGWESSDAEQAEFVETFFRLTEDMDVEVAVWSFMFDPDTIEPFNSMGLINSNGTEKVAWNKWVDAK